MRFVHLATALALATPAVVSAQGRLIPFCAMPADGRRVMTPCQAQVVRTRSDVRGVMTGRVIQYTVSEAFTNRGGRIGEADYMFPLPPGAAFRGLRLSVDGRMVPGETMDAAHARGIYEEIVRKLRDPALVEWMGSGMLRTRIFPIQPGETKRVVVSFETVVPREGDALRVDYTRGGTVGALRRITGPCGRIAPQNTQITQTRRTETCVRGGPMWDGKNSFELVYHRSDEYGRPYSPINQLAVTDSAGMQVVRVKGNPPNVTLLIPVHTGNHAAISVLTHAMRGDSGFAMITVSPPATHAAPSPRDVTFVLDVSGSMAGRKIEQARAAGKELLATLRPTDRFRLVDFSNDVEDFREGFSYATSANVAAAERYLDGLSAGGGTNIAAALDDALGAHAGPGKSSATNERLKLVLFLTDGMPTVGVTDPDRIADRAEQERGNQRLFTFGLGADVNSALLERLAMDGRGTAQFVRPEENVERMVGVVAERLTDPVATDLRVRVSGRDVRLNQVVPEMPMDLFGGQDLVVLARYTGNGPVGVTVQGKSRGHDVRWTSDAHFASGTRENGFIPRLWAAQRIGYLSAERRRNGPSQELDDEIRALGERYGIPTEFTSYLVRAPMFHPAVGPMNGRRLRGSMGASGAIGGAKAMKMVAMNQAASAPQAAFEAARMASAQRAAQSMAVVDSIAATNASGAATRSVAGHTFTLRDGRWVDSRYTDSTRTVRVEAFSKTYFTLLTRIPELRAMAALGDRVVMAGRSVAIEIVPKAPALSTAQVDSVVSAW